MDQEELEQQLNLEVEVLSFNQLHDLGNRAVQMGLLIGHGHRGGRYELLGKEDVVLLSPDEAQTYLQELIQEADSQEAGGQEAGG